MNRHCTSWLCQDNGKYFISGWNAITYTFSWSLSASAFYCGQRSSERESSSFLGQCQTTASFQNQGPLPLELQAWWSYSASPASSARLDIEARLGSSPRGKGASSLPSGLSPFPSCQLYFSLWHLPDDLLSIFLCRLWNPRVQGLLSLLYPQLQEEHPAYNGAR